MHVTYCACGPVCIRRKSGKRVEGESEALEGANSAGSNGYYKGDKAQFFFFSFSLLLFLLLGWWGRKWRLGGGTWTRREKKASWVICKKEWASKLKPSYLSSFSFFYLAHLFIKVIFSTKSSKYQMKFKNNLDYEQVIDRST